MTTNGRTQKITKGIPSLYKAVQRYVKSNGGDIVVIGGVEVQRWPDETDRQFRLAIRCLGKPPKFTKEQP